MPVVPGDPLEVRVLQAVADVVAAVNGENVPAANQYTRAVLDFVPQRDSTPATVVAWTPGRSPSRRALLRKAEWAFPVTALLLDSKGGNVTVPADWRAAWAGRLGEALDNTALGLAEVCWTDEDQLTVLDLSAFEQAGLFRSAVSVLVMVRTALVRA